MTFALADLAAELKSDPNQLGYAVPIAAQNWPEVVALLTTMDQTKQVLPRENADTAAAISYIALADWDALPQAHRDLINAYAVVGRLDFQPPAAGLPPTTVVDNIQGMFPEGTATRTIIDQLLFRAASRAEHLWSAGTTVTIDDVRRALGVIA